MTIIADVHRDARKELLEHCDHISDRQLGRLTRARHMAEWVHRDAIRGTGDLYVTHCYGTEQIACDAGFAHDIDMRITLLLHDTIEDCRPEERKRLRRDIFWRFGPIVYLIVDTLTRVPGKDYSRQIRRRVKLLWLFGLWKTITDKLCDILFNLSTIEGFRNYRREMKQYYKAEHIIQDGLLPCRRYIPAKQQPKFDYLLASVCSLLKEKRAATFARERAEDLGYFPTL